MKYVFIISIFVITSCATTDYKAGLKRRRVESYYSNNGLARYFLPDLPDWANNSFSGHCKLSKRTRYLDIKSLRASFFLSYGQSVQQQLMFNHLKRSRVESLNLENGISLEEEEKLFFESSEKIQANIYLFKKPSFKRINLLWIDPIAQNSKKLKRVMRSSQMANGHPVFISMCYSREELSQLLKTNRLNSLNIRLITQEMFTPFSIENELRPYLSLNVEQFFESHQKINLYLPKGVNRPREIDGKMKLNFY